MKKRIWILGIVIGLILVPVSAVAQLGDEFAHSGVKTFPSPTAASIAKVQELSIDQFNGINTMSIPLYEFSYYGLSVPISLHYSGSGLRVQERASWVGFGWSLKAGGVITRIVRHLPDDSFEGFEEHENTILNFAPDETNPDSSDKATYDDIVDGDIDSEPDKFIISLPGYSGEMFFMDGQYELRSEKKIKIEPVRQGGGLPTANTIISWVLTDESGIKYTFAQKEYTRSTSSTVANSSASSASISTFISSWYLTKIEHPQHSEHIILEYDEGTSPGYGSVQKTFTQLRHIITDTDPLCANKDDDIESINVIDNDAIYLKKIKLSTNNDYYVEFWTQSRTDLPTERRLHYIDISKGATGGEPFDIDFNYGYFTGSGGHQRLKLEEIELTSTVSGQNPLYKFDYVGGSFPNYDDTNEKYAVDHWGYYNGETTNTTTVPDTYFGGVLIYNGANREPASWAAQIGMLSKITFQTGGTASFTYEGNTYSKVANTTLTTVKNTGGVRVASITYQDGISNQNDIVKTYSYDLGGGLSSGEIAQEPYYLKAGTKKVYDSGNQINITCSTQETGPSGFYTIGEYTGNRMGYTKVTESYSSAASNGKIVSYFDINPNVWKGDKLKSETLNSSGSKLKQDSYGHYFSSATSKSNRGFEVERFIYSYKTSPLVTEYDTTWIPKPYTIHQYKTYISSDTTRIYNGASNYVESSRSYAYNSYLLLTSITEKGEGLGSKVTSYSYAAGKYPGMSTKHMYSQLYSVKVAGRKQWMIWDDNVTGKVGYWMPNEQWVWNGTGSSPPTDPDANSIKALDILKYDSYGNVLEANDANGNLSKYYFGDNSNPITQNGINGISGVYLTGIEKIQTGGSGVDLTQTGKYDANGRVTELKDEGGVVLKYTYDGLNRLTQIKDAANVLLEDYTYATRYTGTAYALSNSNNVRTRTYDNGNTLTNYQFFDGLGRLFQTQQGIGGNDFIVQHIFYDELGRQEAVTNPIIHSSGVSFTSISSLVGSSWTPGNALSTANGSIYDYYKNTLGHSDLDSKYAYAQTAYEASPLGRTTKQASPGYAYRINGTRTVDSNYGLNATSNEDFDGTNELGFPTNTLLRQEITNENEVESWLYTDAWGRTVMEIVDLSDNSNISSSGNFDIFTGYEYDGFGNLTKVHEPEGWGTANLKREYTYDKLNRLTSENTPYLDASTEYKYDKAGNLRFVRNAEHKESGSAQTNTRSVSYQNMESSTINYPKNGILDFSVSFSGLSNDYVHFTLEKEDSPDRELYRQTIDGWETSDSGSEILSGGTYHYKAKESYSTTEQWVGSIVENIRPFQFSYTKYDELGRVTEAGEYWGSSSDFTQANAENESWPTSSKQEFTLNYYDVTNGDATATNLTGRLARSRYLDPVTLTWGDTWYSYDSKGRVSWVKQKLPGFSTKRIDYEYTTQGLITEMIYQDGSSTEEMHFWYTYDTANRLTHVYSNREDDFANAKLESNFSYTAEGQVDQQALGGAISSGGAQLLDYDYHIRGWLAKINDPDNTSSPTGFADDRFGMELRYESQSTNSTNWEARYNGDISQIRWKISPPNALSNDNPLYNYKYDNGSRLFNADFHNSNTAYSASNAYDVNIGFNYSQEYYKVGKSGNFVEMRRYNDYVSGGSETFTYRYYDNTNRLKNVIGSTTEEDYKYDAVGNMIFNDDRNVTSIAYNTQNLSYRLIQKYNSTTAYLHEYTYDNAGQRVQKRFKTAENYNTTNVYQNFIRGVDGEVLAVYSGSTLLYWNIPGGIGRITKF